MHTTRRMKRTSSRSSILSTACEPLERRTLLAIAPLGPEFQVNSWTTLTQADAVIASDADGDFVVAWRSRDQDGSLYGIYAQRYNSAGVLQGPEFRVNTFTTGNQTSPAIAMDADGDFVIAWESAGQDSGTYGVYFQRYNASGVAQGGEMRANTFTPNDQIGPAVGMDDNGNFVVAWHSFGQDGSNWGVYAQRHDASGVAQGGEFRVNTFTTGSQTSPAVGFHAGGNIVIAWESFLQEDPTSLGIYAQRYDSAGVAQGGEFHVNTFTTGDQRYPAVAVADAGKFVITWQSTGQDGSFNGVYAQRFSASGVHEGPEFRANTFTPNSQEEPSIAMDAAGNFLIAWTSGGQDPTDGIFAQRYDAAGVPQGGEFRVNTYTTNHQIRPAIAMDADGDAVIAWQSEGQDGSGWGTYAQRYAVVPGVTSSSFHIATLPQRLTFTFDRPMSGSLFSLDSVVVQTLLDGSIVAPSGISYDAPSNTATVSFNTPVPDGNLRAVLLGSGFISTAGVPLAGNHYFNFSFLRGDANQDGRVNLNDFNTLAANFGQSPRDFTQGDFNYDTIVNLNDFNILAAGFGTSVPAYPTPVGNEISVSASTALNVSIASDDAGNYVVVYARPEAGDQSAVYARRYDANGAPLGSEFKVNVTLNANISVTRVAMDADGDFVVSWASGTSGGSAACFARRFNSAGVAQGGDIFIDFAEFQKTGTLGRTGLAMDADGDFVVTFIDYSSSALHAQRYNALGVPQGGAITVAVPTAAEFPTFNQVAMDDDGDFVVVWNRTDAVGGIESRGIYARRYNAAGVPQATAFHVNSLTNSGREPTVSMDADDDFVIAWSGAGAGDSQGIYARRYNAFGIAQGGEFLVNTYTTNAQSFPALSSDSDGNFLIAWDSDGQDGDSNGVYARLFDRAGTPVGEEFRVNTTTAGFQARAAATLNDDGDFSIAWRSGLSPSNVHAQRFHAVPPPVFVLPGDEFQVNTYTTSEQLEAAVAIHDSGDFVVVWDGLGAQGEGIYARRYNSAGIPQGSEFAVDTGGFIARNSPVVAMDSDGDFVVAWGDGSGSPLNYDIFARRYNAAGTPLGLKFRVNSFGTSSQDDPTIAMEPDGDVVIAWRSYGQDGSGNGIYAKRYNAAGGSSNEFRVNTFTTGDQAAPSVSMDASGNFVVAWHSFGQDGSGYGVYAQRYNAAGVAQGGEFRANTYTTNWQFTPITAMDDGGDFVIAWTSDGQDGDMRGAYAQRFNAAGAPHGPEFRVNTHTTSSQIAEGVAMDADGDFIVTWRTVGQDGPGPSYAVYATRYDAAGAALTEEFRVNAHTTNNQFRSDVAMDGAGNFVIVWDSFDQDGDRTGIFGRYSVGLPAVGGLDINDEPNIQRDSVLWREFTRSPFSGQSIKSDSEYDLIEELLNT